MGLGAWAGRHRAAMAGNLALLLAAGAVVTYAVTAEGYQAHDARLNDGGIWVTNSRDGYFGRVNKPIGQLDGALFARLDADLDIVQDGSSVVGVDLSTGLVKPIDPATVQHPEGEEAGIPGAAGVGLAGDTLAVVDPVSGKVWAERVDPSFGSLTVSQVDSGSTPVATVGKDASLAVTQSGDVLAVSAAEDTLTRLAASDSGFEKAQTDDLPGDLTTGTQVTAVGDTAVVLDPQGELTIVGGPQAAVPAGSVLQQAGPGADAVLVDAKDSLLSVDLESGEVTTLASGVAGHPSAPVHLGACAYGAWSGGSGAVATVCEGADPVVAGLQGSASDVVFRVNRGEIVLNDRDSGAVWNIDSDQPTRIDDWESFRQKEDPDHEHNQNEVESNGDLQPPKAKPDTFGARPGRTTVLHPLDNDTAPQGRLLAISAIKGVHGKADVTVSPDGQTVQVRMPEGTATGTSFEYYIDDGREGLSAHAGVTVNLRGIDDPNTKPQLREGFKPKEWTVPASGAIDVPVLPDWRDQADGDQISLVSASVVGASGTGADARTTAGGLVRFLGSPTGGDYTVNYTVSDGMGGEVRNELKFHVQDKSDRDAVAATAQPDIVSGEAGKPITINPLGNDLPGSDPVTPNAELTLAGRVAEPGGTAVATDLVDGTLTLTADRPRTYFLSYDAAYGDAPLATGKIRVDVRASRPDEPVAMPDNLTLYGQSASLVDVLANDVDPAGSMLVVQHAEAVTDNQLDVAVVDGRWLRVSARQGQLTPNPQVVHYTISNGNSSGVQGEVVVNQQAAPADNAPVTEPDRVTVRAGAAVSIAVLDNDFSPSGDALSLVTHVTDETSGTLPVQIGGDQKVPTGAAFVAGRLVRYVAPADLTSTQTFTVPYLATNAQGDRAPGKAEITVVPVGKRNQPPEPPTLEGRVVAGDTVQLKLPGAQVDPDGDAVTVLGIASAPTLGRVVKYGANSVEYQAYPGSSGTDQFTYLLTDTQGAVSTGTVRVGVVPPGSPQPPLAVADAITVEPGRTARVDVLANDLIAAGDRVSVRLIDPPAGVELESDTGPVVMTAPDKIDGRNLEVVYAIDNGIDTSQATVTLRTARPYNNPPVVFDAFGQADAGEEVKVDVLKTAYDPDGPSESLEISDVFPPSGVEASAEGSVVTVRRGPQPVVLPFRVVDADGGAATASLFVPAAGQGPPYVKSDGVIRLDPGETKSFKVPDFVENPSGGSLQLTYKNRVWPSPEGKVDASITGEGSFEVSAAKGYQGPGAVTLEVTTGTSPDDPQGVKSVLSVPVQVGNPVPILRCPTDVVEIPQAESVDLDIAALCHVWTADPADIDSLSFDADWNTSAAGLSIIQPSGSSIKVAASGDAKPGTEAKLKVSSGDSAAGELRLRVIKSPPPSLAPIRVADMRAGESRTIDLAKYLTAGVSDPVPTVLKVSQVSELDIHAVKAGQSSVTLTTGKRVDGVAQFDVVMSDVAGSSAPERQVHGRITLEVLDVPDAPKAPVPGNAVRSQEVHLDWGAPQENGSPITYYEVQARGGKTQRCSSTSCDITGLTNGTAYTFKVRAHNAVGDGPWSPVSKPATPDALPGMVGPIEASKIGDQTITIHWTAPTTQTSDIRWYWVTWQDGSRKTTSPSITISGLDNNRVYTFTVQAENHFGVGAKRASQGYQTIGVPGTPAAPTITDQQTAGDQGAVALTWPAVDPNGPKSAVYSVYRNGSPLPQCQKITATSCNDSGITYDGKSYAYKVRATNQSGQGKTSPFGAASTWNAVGQPADWSDFSTAPTGSDNQGTITFTAPKSRGAQSTVYLLVDGNRSGKTWSPSPTGQSYSNEPITMQADGVSYTLSLEVCNEKGACTTSSQTHPLQTYGPVGVGSLSSSSGTTEAHCTWPVNPNGLTSSVYIGGSFVQSVGPGDGTVNVTRSVTGYNQTVDCDLKVTTENGTRGDVTKSGPTESTGPPPPTVTLSQGAHCNDGNSLPDCNTGGGGIDCTHPSCAHIHLSSSNVPGGSMQCTIHSQEDSNGWGSGTFNANTSYDTSRYYGYGGNWIYVTCSAGGKTFDSDHGYHWPTN